MKHTNVYKYYHEMPQSMRGSRKFCQRGSNFDNVFLSLMRGGTNSGPSETPFKWRYAGLPMMALH